MDDTQSIEGPNQPGNDPLETFYCRFLLFPLMESYEGKVGCKWTFFGTRREAQLAFGKHLDGFSSFEQKLHHLGRGKKEQG